MFAPVITITIISLTRRRIVLTATDRSACPATDRSTDDGTVLATDTLTDRSTCRSTQHPAQHRATINSKSAGTHKKQRSNC
jgi:hypothetical protein